MTKRHFCNGCEREWLFAYNWNGESCPACGSADITVVEYQPAFAGADLPRSGPVAVPVTEVEDRDTFVQANHTLALTGEVDPYVEQLGALLGESL